MKQQQYNSNSFTFLRFNKKYKNYNINLLSESKTFNEVRKSDS